MKRRGLCGPRLRFEVDPLGSAGLLDRGLSALTFIEDGQTIPIAIAAMKPIETSAASTLSRIERSIVASCRQKPASEISSNIGHRDN